MGVDASEAPAEGAAVQLAAQRAARLEIAQARARARARARNRGRVRVRVRRLEIV